MKKRRFLLIITFVIVLGLAFFARSYESLGFVNITISANLYGLLVLAMGGAFTAIFFWLHNGNSTWYQTKGIIVDRMHAMNRYNGPIVEYTDVHGNIRRAEAQRVAFYWPKHVKIRVAPDGTYVHVMGTEWLALLMAVILVASGFTIMFT